MSKFTVKTFNVSTISDPDILEPLNTLNVIVEFDDPAPAIYLAKSIITQWLRDNWRKSHSREDLLYKFIMYGQVPIVIGVKERKFCSFTFAKKLIMSIPALVNSNPHV